MTILWSPPRIAEFLVGDQGLVGERFQKLQEVAFVLPCKVKPFDEIATIRVLGTVSCEVYAGNSPPTYIVVLKNLLQSPNAPVMHVRSRKRDIAQRWGFEFSHVFGCLRKCVESEVVPRIRAGAGQVI